MARYQPLTLIFPVEDQVLLVMPELPSAHSLHRLFQEAYHWLCQRRKKHQPSSDIWDFRRSWGPLAEEIMESFRRGAYRFGLQKKVALRDGETIALWSSVDALVIKVLTRIVQAILQPALSRPSAGPAIT